jgi:hypothetical protein
MTVERIWLDVPFAEKDSAKQAGARWDPAARRWYAPHPGIAAIDRWAAAPDIPDLLPGEDRSLGAGLFVDLVPSTCWFTNVRSCVAAKDWERLRRTVTNRASQRCEVCAASADRDAQQWLEVHERWTYDEVTKVQRLGRLICLCTKCHTVTHFGLAQIKGLEKQALQHLMTVTGMTSKQASTHVETAFDLWHIRCLTHWTLDLSILTDAGVTLAAPPTADDRADVAQATLRSVRSNSAHGSVGNNHESGVPVRVHTVTLVAAPLGSLLPGRPVDWNDLPQDARAWAKQQADNDNEMLTVLDGDHRAELGADYDIYVVKMG